MKTNLKENVFDINVHYVENVKFEKYSLTNVLRIRINNCHDITLFINDKATYKAITAQIKEDCIKEY